MHKGSALRKFIFVFFLIPICLGFSEKNKNERIKELIENKDYESAINEINVCINEDASIERYGVRAFLYQKVGRYEEAVADYNKCLEDIPESPDLWNAAGLCYLELENHFVAIQCFNRAIELSTDLSYGDVSVYYHNRGRAKVECNDIENAVDDFTKSILVNPDKAVCFADRAFCFNRMRNFNAAEKDIRKAIELAPNYESAHLIYGQIYMAQGKYKKAITKFDRAIKINPDCSDGYYYKAFCYLKLNNKRKALYMCEKALNLDPGNKKYLDLKLSL